MKAMHTTLAALLLGTAMSGAAFAQTANTDTSNTQSATQSTTEKTGRGGRGMKALNLTDDQKKQIKQFHQDAKTQAAAIKKDQTLSADQKKAKLQELHQSTQDKVASVLTPEQKQKWDEMKASHKGKHHRHKKGATTQQPS